VIAVVGCKQGARSGAGRDGTALAQSRRIVDVEDVAFLGSFMRPRRDRRDYAAGDSGLSTARGRRYFLLLTSDSATPSTEGCAGRCPHLGDDEGCHLRFGMFLAVFDQRTRDLLWVVRPMSAIKLRWMAWGR